MYRAPPLLGSPRNLYGSLGILRDSLGAGGLLGIPRGSWEILGQRGSVHQGGTIIQVKPVVPLVFKRAVTFLLRLISGFH